MASHWLHYIYITFPTCWTIYELLYDLYAALRDLGVPTHRCERCDVTVVIIEHRLEGIWRLLNAGRSGMSGVLKGLKEESQ